MEIHPWVNAVGNTEKSSPPIFPKGSWQQGGDEGQKVRPNECRDYMAPRSSERERGEKSFVTEKKSESS